MDSGVASTGTQGLRRTELTEVLAGLRQSDEGLAVTIPADWSQGRAIYGGLSAALCLAAARRTFDGLPPLRSALISFIGPAADRVTLSPTRLRQGKSTSIVNVDLICGDAITVRANFSFGTGRESRFSGHWRAAPDVPDAADCGPLFPKERVPGFATHFDMRRAAGPAVMSGADSGDVCAWIRHDDQGAAESIEGLVALADALPPAAITMFTGMAPISTMTWMFDVVSDGLATRDGWWLSRSVSESTSAGYSSQKMAMWNRDGEPVVIGQQNVAIFA